MRVYLTLPLFLFVQFLHADTLTIGQAVEVGLKNNFAIRIARNTTEKSYNTRKLKAGAMLPTIRVDGSAATTHTTYATAGGQQPSGNVNELKGSAALNWTLFDGFRMFHAARQIERQIDQSEFATRHEIESAVVAIMTAYYHLVAQHSLLDAAVQQLALSRSQLSFVKAQYEYGRIGKRELLNQEVMINTDSSQVLSRQLDLVSALHALNIALGRPPATPVSLEADTNVNVPEHDAAWWYHEALKHNTGLKITKIRKLIACSQHAIARASLWPTLSVNGSAVSMVTEPDDYFRTRGEVTLSIPLFNGFNRITAVENAAIDTLNAALAIKQKRLELQSLVYEQWERLRISCDQVSFEKLAITRAEQALELGSEQFRLGRISDIQLRETQIALINARIRLQTALFRNKVVMLQLRQLAGALTVSH